MAEPVTTADDASTLLADAAELDEAFLDAEADADAVADADTTAEDDAVGRILLRSDETP